MICKSFVWSMVSKHALTSNLTKYIFGLFVLLASEAWEEDGKENTNGSQSGADIPSAETKFILLQLLVYFVGSKDSIPG